MTRKLLVIPVAVMLALALAVGPAEAQRRGGGRVASGGRVGIARVAPVVVARHAVPRPAILPRRVLPVVYYGYPGYFYGPRFGLGIGLGYGYGYGYGYPYWGYPYGYYGYYGYPYYPYYGGIPPAYGYGSAAYGGIRIDLPQKDAAVYVDGYYAGIVDDFDGVLQRLTLEPGAHHIEIKAAGFIPLAFDVNVDPGRTIHYRASLIPQ